jgi:lactoylglutathione lyase
MEIRLLVLRTGDPSRLAAFYSSLGYAFEYHKHGNSPYHYSATIRSTVLEIYPLAKGQVEADKNLRLGFGINNFDEVIHQLKTLQISFAMEATQTDFGFMAVIVDPDGRKVELYKIQ